MGFPTEIFDKPLLFASIPLPSLDKQTQYQPPEGVSDHVSWLERLVEEVLLHGNR